MNTIERVLELANERNLSLFSLSKQCQVPYSTLKNAEVRQTQLAVDTIELICSGIGISMSDFFAEEEQ